MPIKDKFFATVKSTNYLQNALVAKEAEEKGASVGIWLDEEGNIAEGQNMNVGFLTDEGELLLPTFDRILSGCTAQRVLQLVPELVKKNAIPGLKGVRLTKIPESEARKAKEMMLIMSAYMILPVVEWDGKPVGSGKSVSLSNPSCKYTIILVHFTNWLQIMLFFLPSPESFRFRAVTSSRALHMLKWLSVLASTGKPGPVSQALLRYMKQDMVAGPTALRTPVPYGNPV